MSESSSELGHSFSPAPQLAGRALSSTACIRLSEVGRQQYSDAGTGGSLPCQAGDQVDISQMLELSQCLRAWVAGYMCLHKRRTEVLDCLVLLSRAWSCCCLLLCASTAHCKGNLNLNGSFGLGVMTLTIQGVMKYQTMFSVAYLGCGCVRTTLCSIWIMYSPLYILSPF